MLLFRWVLLACTAIQFTYADIDEVQATFQLFKDRPVKNTELAESIHRTATTTLTPTTEIDAHSDYETLDVDDVADAVHVVENELDEAGDLMHELQQELDNSSISVKDVFEDLDNDSTEMKGISIIKNWLRESGERRDDDGDDDTTTIMTTTGENEFTTIHSVPELTTYNLGAIYVENATEIDDGVATQTTQTPRLDVVETTMRTTLIVDDYDMGETETTLPSIESANTRDYEAETTLFSIEGIPTSIVYDYQTKTTLSSTENSTPLIGDDEMTQRIFVEEPNGDWDVIETSLANDKSTTQLATDDDDDYKEGFSQESADVIETSKLDDDEEEIELQSTTLINAITEETSTALLKEADEEDGREIIVPGETSKEHDDDDESDEEINLIEREVTTTTLPTTTAETLYTRLNKLIVNIQPPSFVNGFKNFVKIFNNAQATTAEPTTTTTTTQFALDELEDIIDSSELEASDIEESVKELEKNEEIKSDEEVEEVSAQKFDDNLNHFVETIVDNLSEEIKEIDLSEEDDGDDELIDETLEMLSGDEDDVTATTTMTIPTSSDYKERCSIKQFKIFVTHNNIREPIPDDAWFVGNCSENSKSFEIYWEYQQENNTLFINFNKIAQDWYISYIKILFKDVDIITDVLENIQIKLENHTKINMEEAKVEFANVEFDDDKTSEGTVYLMLPLNALALQIASGIVCILIVLIVVGVFAYRKIKTSTRIFKIAA